MLGAMTTTTAPFDPTDRAHTADPAPHLAAARHGCPVSRPRPGLVVLAADTDVRAGLKDIARFSNRGAFSLDGDAVLPVPMITMTDPPEHTELRAHLKHWFSPPALRRLEPRVREIVEEVVRTLPTTGTFDLYDACVRAVPSRVVFALIGLPSAEWDGIERLADRVAEDLPGPVHLLPEFGELMARLTAVLDRREAAGPTGTDVIDGLLHPGDGERALSRAEVLTHLTQLVMAGTDTTRSAATNLLHELLVDPSRWERVRAERELLPGAVEESLRHDAPLQYVLRSARTDTEVQGEPVAAGEKVLLSVQSANWDTTRWGADADAFSLDRLTPAAHLSFGLGIHTCLGPRWPASRSGCSSTCCSTTTRACAWPTASAGRRWTGRCCGGPVASTWWSADPAGPVELAADTRRQIVDQSVRLVSNLDLASSPTVEVHCRS